MQLTNCFIAFALVALALVNLIEAQLCQCNALVDCVSRKKEMKKADRQQCRDSCETKSGLTASMKSNLESCKNNAKKEERKQKRKAMRQCVWTESKFCSGSFPAFRVKRQGQGRRGGRGKGFKKAIGEENYNKLPLALKDFATCLKEECKRKRGGRNGGEGNGNGGGRGRGNGGRGRGKGKGGKGKGKRGGKLIKECAAETSGCESIDRSGVREAKQTCRERLGIEKVDKEQRQANRRADKEGRKEERMQRRKEKCECLERGFNVGLDCTNLPQREGRRNRQEREVESAEEDDEDEDEDDDGFPDHEDDDEDNILDL